VFDAHRDHFIKVRVMFDQLMKAFLNYPRDMGLWVMFPQSPQEGQGVYNIPYRA